MSDITPNTETFTTTDAVPDYKEGNTKELLGKVAGNVGYCKRKSEFSHRLGDQTTLGTNPTPSVGAKDPNNLGGFIHFYWAGLPSGTALDDRQLIDDTADWRDRLLYAVAFRSTSSSGRTPGGANDNDITCYIETAGTDNSLYYYCVGYTHAGVDATGSNIQISFGSDNSGFMVDSTTGYLYYLDKNVGNPSSVNMMIHYTQQLGYRDD